MGNIAHTHEDRAPVRGPLSRLSSPQHLRVYEGIAARTHTPQNPLRYSWGNEHRDASELQSIVSQLPGKSFTLLHPDDLLSSGSPATIIGKVRDARVDSDANGAYAVVSLEITDSKGWDAVESGTHELSLGYTSRLDGDRYQRDIRVDHLALVPAGRCGSTCALRSDSTISVNQYRKDIDGIPNNSSHNDAPCCASCASRYPDFVPENSAASVSDVIQATARAVVESMHSDKTLNAKQRHALPSHLFADPADEGLPLEDPSHVRDAMARFNQKKFQSPAARKTAYHHIVARAHELGIDSSNFAKEYGGNYDSASAEDIVMDELKKQLSEAIADAAAQKARADKAEQDLAASTKRADALELERDEANRNLKVEAARADKAEANAKADVEKARLDASTDADARVNAKVALVVKATEILGSGDYASMSDRAIKVAVVKHVDGIELDEKRSDEYVDATYDGSLMRYAKVVDKSTKATQSRADARVATERVRNDATNTNDKTISVGIDAERIARQAMIDGLIYSK